MSRRQAIIGHLQLFGKILLKQLNQTHTHIQQQHPHTHSSSNGVSSLETTAAFSTTATTTATSISPFSLSHLRTHGSTADSLRQMATATVAAVTGVVAAATVAKIEAESSEHPKQQQQQQDMSTYFPFIFPDTPSFIESTRAGLRGSRAKQGGREGQGQDRLPCVSTTMGPRPSILPLTSIHQFISLITSTSLPALTNTADTTATSGTAGTGTGTLVRGQALNFCGTSHHHGFLILLPDLDEDLILDLTPTLERVYGSPLHPTSEGDDIDAGLTIVLFEEDEVPKKMWTLTIPRPLGSVLPRSRVRPGQEREIRRGRRREGQFRDVSGGGYGAGCSSGGGVGGGGMGWEVDEQSVLVLRHWVSAVWNAYDRWDRYRERWLSIGAGGGGCDGEAGYTWEEESCGSGGDSRKGGGYEVTDIEDRRTEPRVSGLFRSINRLNGLVT